MRILIAANHCYPSYRAVGRGRHPTEFPSGSSGHMQDLLARGLAELGHDVRYLLRAGCDAPVPEGVRIVSDPSADIDIYQSTTAPGANPPEVWEFVERRAVPRVLTCHLDRSHEGERARAGDNWIFVSRSLARTYGRSRYVLNGIDPADCAFSGTKEDFLLFMAPAEYMLAKGLATALAVSKRTGVRLVVAGTGRSYPAIDRIAAMCREADAEYIGDIRGSAKAERLAVAKALILPTRSNEGCPLTLMEALMSGTPVIASTAGGIPEVVAPGTGFLCIQEEDYVRAVERLGEISPERCRDYAREQFHYLRMAQDYVREFEAEIDRHPDHAHRSAVG
jgi:glycosyltransferase involved in cell wall biosynthesis